MAMPLPMAAASSSSMRCRSFQPQQQQQRQQQKQQQRQQRWQRRPVQALSSASLNVRGVSASSLPLPLSLSMSMSMSRDNLRLRQSRHHQQQHQQNHHHWRQHRLRPRPEPCGGSRESARRQRSQQQSRTLGGAVVTKCKMMVPDLNGRSPEGRAADSLHNFFTYVAVRVVLSQLQAYNPEGYKELRAFTEKHPNGLKDGDKFCAALMRESPRHKALALRILEVRAAYCSEDFEWDNLKTLSKQKVEHSNRQLMCEFLIETSRLE